MDLKELTMSLSAQAGVSGVDCALQLTQQAISPYAAPKRDNMGGLLAIMDFGRDTTILLDAHLDEIGLIVTGIDEDGFVRVAKSGGVDIRTLMGQQVRIHAENTLRGVFCCPVPHLNKDEKNLPPLEDMAIDIGFSKEQAEKRVHPGDRVSFLQTPASLRGGKVTGKSLDNRAGVAALIRTAELLSGKDCGVNVAFAFSAQEEVGCRGARTMAYDIFPKEAIVVDVSFGDGAGIPENRCGKLENGVMVGIAPSLSQKISRRMIDLAKKHSIPYQLESMGGTTSTNADVISLIKTGVPCGLLSIPLRNMHTAVETISLTDLEATAQLLYHYLIDWRPDNA